MPLQPKLERQKLKYEFVVSEMIVESKEQITTNPLLVKWVRYNKKIHKKNKGIRSCPRVQTQNNKQFEVNWINELSPVRLAIWFDERHNKFKPKITEVKLLEQIGKKESLIAKLEVDLPAVIDSNSLRKGDYILNSQLHGKTNAFIKLRLVIHYRLLTNLTENVRAIEHCFRSSILEETYNKLLAYNKPGRLQVNYRDVNSMISARTYLENEAGHMFEAYSEEIFAVEQKKAKIIKLKSRLNSIREKITKRGNVGSKEIKKKDEITILLGVYCDCQKIKALFSEEKLSEADRKKVLFGKINKDINEMKSLNVNFKESIVELNECGEKLGEANKSLILKEENKRMKENINRMKKENESLEEDLGATFSRALSFLEKHFISLENLKEKEQFMKSIEEQLLEVKLKLADRMSKN